MELRRPIADAVELAVNHVIIIAVISVSVTAASMPFLLSFTIRSPLNWIVGLWTSSLLLGLIGIGSFAVAVTAHQRGARIHPDVFWKTMRIRWRAGLLVGVASFFVATIAIGSILAPVAGLPGHVVGLLGIYVVATWFALLGFSLPEFGYSADTPLTHALRVGVACIFHRPVTVLWFLVQTIGWTLIAALTVVSVFLLLPGFLTFLAVVFQSGIREDLGLHAEGSTGG